jgi:hypothetical protein
MWREKRERGLGKQTYKWKITEVHNFYRLREKLPTEYICISIPFPLGQRRITQLSPANPLDFVKN